MSARGPAISPRRRAARRRRAAAGGALLRGAPLLASRVAARRRGRLGVVPAAPAEPSVVADDEDAFDPDDYPEFDVEEV